MNLECNSDGFINSQKAILTRFRVGSRHNTLGKFVSLDILTWKLKTRFDFGQYFC